jgi:16S rRNA (cytidine1402-2'-O)-methyltransferase
MSENSCTLPGSLYLVATPIGNMGDMGFRSVDILKNADFIACEDTRKSQPLLRHYNINRPLLSLHEHNEDKIAARLVKRILAGENAALISDAGTPIINDPGYPLVYQAIESGIRVCPIPGPCALIAALSASGLPCHRFAFEGFPPRKSQARITYFESLKKDSRTLIFYESSHRIEQTAADIGHVFPPTRKVVFAKELTKHYETMVRTSAHDAKVAIASNPEMKLGEFVILIEGFINELAEHEVSHEDLRILSLLLSENSTKTAVRITSEITGTKRDDLYKEAIRLRETGSYFGS